MNSKSQQINVPPSATAAGGSLLLNYDDIVQLTGTVQALRQCRWLEERGWPFVVAVGRGQFPRVARSVFDLKMMGRDSTRPALQPRFDALDGLGGAA